MKKLSDISLAVEHVVIEGQQLLRMVIPPGSVRDWCLCLQLVQEKLVDQAVFLANGRSQKVTLELGLQNRFGRSTQNAALVITFDERTLEFVRHFFLRYYRDGGAQVDHIDIEVHEGGVASDLIISVEAFAPPTSEVDPQGRIGTK